MTRLVAVFPLLCFLCCIYLGSLVFFSDSEKLPPCHKQENKQADSSCPVLLKSYFKTEHSDFSKTIFLIKRKFNFERQMLIFKAISNSYFELRYIHKQVYLLHNRLNL